MPYSAEHKAAIRKKVVEAGRKLFNRYGYNSVSIDQVMAEAGLTRGGFYNHFASKEELFAEAVDAFLHGRGAEWRSEAGVREQAPDLESLRAMLRTYLSDEHLADLDGQCPMIALPSDVARAGDGVQQSFQRLLNAMVWLLETGLEGNSEKPRQEALALAAMSVGAMVLAKTLPGSPLAGEIRSSSLDYAMQRIAG